MFHCCPGWRESSRSCGRSSDVTDTGGRRNRARTIADLAAPLESMVLHGDPSMMVSGLEFDSRLVTDGDLFAALPGADFDGHAFAPRAIAAGAAALLVERSIESDIAQIVVPDSRAALAPIAAEFHDHPSRDLTCIGITGTDGKTTTSSIIDDILRYAGVRSGVIGTVGIRLGDGRTLELPHQTTPESNLVQRYLREMVDAEVRVAVVEATSHGLAMHRLDGTRFMIGGVTNITHEHLEYHGTVEAYRRAKAILLERVGAEHGVVALNADDEGAMSIRDFAAGASIVTYGVETSHADMRAVHVVVRNDGTDFTLQVDGTSSKVRLPLIGSFNVANALCAISVARAAGVPLETCVEAVARANGVRGRMQPIVLGQPFAVIVDYAHTPESIAKVLTLLGATTGGSRLIIVTGSAGERDPGKRPLQGMICARLATVSIFTNEDPRNEDPERILAEIAAGAVDAGGIECETFFRIVDRREAIARALSIAGPGDCVLLAGKGHERSIIVGYEHQPWDEVGVVRTLLAERGFVGGEEVAG